MRRLISWIADWPLWAKIGWGLLALVIVIAALSSSPEEEVATDATTGETTTTAVEETTTSEATTTTISIDPRLVFEVTFEANRDDIADIYRSDYNIESLDQFTYDAETETVILGVTSRWAGSENQADGAWEITRVTAVLYERGEGNWYQDDFVPAFRLMNSGTTYNCSGDLMVRLGSLDASRSDWESEC